ncbi:hypothetical protein H5T53_04615 [Candidatus Bipolaricaulota bacterium]|nr:hypothetical protein [Candidatus Bipolaricaulota bacterium]
MERWFLIAVLVVIAGLLGAMLWVLFGLAERGIPVQFGGEVALKEPVGVSVMQVEVVLPEPLAVELVQPVTAVIPGPLAVEASPGGMEVRASLAALTCPRCGEGPLVPVRWNLLTGEITWRCLRCGYTAP